MYDSKFILFISIISEDKIKSIAIAAAVVGFVLGISTVLLATALLCKAKPRKRTKERVYHQSYQKPRSFRGPRENKGFESASQYHVTRYVIGTIHYLERLVPKNCYVLNLQWQKGPGVIGLSQDVPISSERTFVNTKICLFHASLRILAWLLKPDQPPSSTRTH